MDLTKKELKELLENVGYISNSRIEFAILSAINNKKPLIIEGAPGVGKTSLAKAVSSSLNLPLKRVQFFDGLTVDKILYDYNYQKQLLSIEAIKSVLEQNLENKNIEEALKEVSKINFYNEDFLIPRPILESILSEDRTVLLLDELDKSSEEIEHILLEFLEEYSVSIPEYGTVKAEPGKEPIVIITSNNFRSLSEPLKRRCSYIYIEDKTVEENTNIILKKTQADDRLARAVALCLSKFKQKSLEQQPSIAEAISWVEAILSGQTPQESIYLIRKHKKDTNKILDAINSVSFEEKVED